MFNDALGTLQIFLKEIQKERMELRSHKQLTPASLDSITLSNEVAELWIQIKKAVQQDINRYAPLEINTPEGAPQPLTTPVGPQPEEGEPAILQVDATPQSPNFRSGLYTAQFISNISPYFELPDFSEMPADLPTPTKLLFARTLDDITYLSDNLGNFGAAGLSTLQKIRKVSEYIHDGATSSALRLLKAARAADPHNNTLAHIFSQVEYFHVNHGYVNALPDARSEGHKSGAINEALDGQTLLKYKYDAVSSERTCSDKRAIEWLQEFYILDPEQTGGSGAGLAKHEALHLKSWMLLATIDSELWGDYVFNSIIGLIDDTVAGAALYLHLLRPKVAKELKRRAVAPAGIEELEKQLGISYAAYQEIKIASQKWGSDSTTLPWTVRNRFLTDIYSLGKIPAFDEILMNIALNGRSLEKRAFPTGAFIEKGYEKEQYWRLWAIALAPENAQRTCNILPFVETALEKDFYFHCEKALVSLEQEEQILIDQDEWDIIEPHMPHLTLDHLLAASTRSDRPRSKFVPTIPPFNTYYREWGKELPSAPLPSTLIRKNAELGAFASAQEIFAALDGAALLIKDPNYGLENQQKQARAIAQRKTKRSFFGSDSYGTNKRTSDEEVNIGQMFVYVFIPLLVVSFIAFFLIQIF